MKKRACILQTCAHREVKNGIHTEKVVFNLSWHTQCESDKQEVSIRADSGIHAKSERARAVCTKGEWHKHRTIEKHMIRAHLGELPVLSLGQETRAETTHYGLQITILDVETTPHTHA